MVRILSEILTSNFMACGPLDFGGLPPSNERTFAGWLRQIMQQTAYQLESLDRRLRQLRPRRHFCLRRLRGYDFCELTTGPTTGCEFRCAKNRAPLAGGGIRQCW